MQHLNYCRQALTAYNCGDVKILKWPGVKYERADVDIANTFSCLEKSIKFILPQNGRTMNDIELRALEGAKLELPYPCVALEYEAVTVSPIEQMFSKRIVLAVDMGATGARDVSGFIVVSLVCFSDMLKKWVHVPPVFVEKDDYVRVENNKPVLWIRPTIEIPIDDYADEVFALLDFLNALACKNVHAEKSPAKATKQGKKVKAALPFDDYHYLTVDVPGKGGSRGDSFGGTGRSPREHLRRGHIRRLESGPIWVNACVVNAGIGSKIGKSYLVRRAPR